MKEKLYRIHINSFGRLTSLFQIDWCNTRANEVEAHGRFIHSEDEYDWSRDKIYVKKEWIRTKCQLLNYIFKS